MKKILLLLCVAAFCIACMGVADAAIPSAAIPAAATAAATWNPDDTPPTLTDVTAAARHARATHCKTPACKAIIVIHELVEIVRFENGDANGPASIRPSNRPRIAGRRLERVLLGHPDLYGAVCATGAKLIRRFRAGPGVREWYVPTQLLINAVDIDLRDHGHCAEGLVLALPKDPANDEIRLNANILCVNGDENQHRPKAACDVLIHGLHTGR